MPITQNRMIAAVQALRACIECIRDFRVSVEETCAEVFAGKVEPREAIQQIYNLAYAMQVPEAALEIVSAEERHFEINRARNELNAERMRRLRGKPSSLPYASSRADARAFVRAQRLEQTPLPAGYIPPSPEAEAALDKILAEVKPMEPPRAALPQARGPSRAGTSALPSTAPAEAPRIVRFTRSDGVEVEVEEQPLPNPDKPLLD